MDTLLIHKQIMCVQTSEITVLLSNVRKPRNIKSQKLRRIAILHLELRPNQLVANMIDGRHNEIHENDADM